VLAVASLSVSFPGAHGSIRIVDDVSFVLERGELLGIVGESGSGKSLTAMAIANLVQYPGTVTGSVKLQGRDIHEIPVKDLGKVLGTSIAVVFQDPLVSLNPALRIGTQLTEGTLTHTDMSRAEANALAASRLTEVMIPAPERQLRRHPHELSGGMRQRVIIAMALVNRPDLLIADEPTTGLDLVTQAAILRILTDLKERLGLTVMLITHDVQMVMRVADELVILQDGCVVEQGPADKVNAAPQQEYTRRLLNTRLSPLAVKV
jgi:ABC-type dipeptide/oligopeptide/nickel transport system ATPase component